MYSETPARNSHDFPFMKPVCAPHTSKKGQSGMKQLLSGAAVVTCEYLDRWPIFSWNKSISRKLSTPSSFTKQSLKIRNHFRRTSDVCCVVSEHNPCDRSLPLFCTAPNLAAGEDGIYSNIVPVIWAMARYSQQLPSESQDTVFDRVYKNMGFLRNAFPSVFRFWIVGRSWQPGYLGDARRKVYWGYGDFSKDKFPPSKCLEEFLETVMGYWTRYNLERFYLSLLC